MKKISTLSAPALAGVIREKTAREAIAAIKNCVYDGADMIDLHLSCLDDCGGSAVETILCSTALPVLALNYNVRYDWSAAGFSEEERTDSLLRAAAAGAACVDMQGYTFHAPSKNAFCGSDRYSFTKNNPKEIVTDETVIRRQKQWIDRVHAMGAEVLLSCHPGIPMNSRQTVELARFLEERNPDIIKIVTIADDTDALLESFRTMLALKEKVKTPVSYHAAGAAGRLSRVLNPVLGGHIVFCVDRYDAGSTMEQMDLRTTKSIVENLKKVLQS